MITDVIPFDDERDAHPSLTKADGRNKAHRENQWDRGSR